MRYTISIIISMLCFTVLYAQQPKDTGVFIEYKAGYYQNSILKGIEEYENPHIQRVPRKYFSVDMSQHKLFNNPDKYTSIWRQPATSQGNSGTCWSFGACSMYESEIWRITGNSVKLSEMFFVYWDYVDRAVDFVQTRGETYFAEGSESNALVRLMEKYGAMPYSVYSGMLPGQKVHNHEGMFEEMMLYLNSVKEKNAWNEEVVESCIINILNSYMGTPPDRFTFNGQEYDSRSFLRDACQINPRDYVSFMSTMTLPYNQKGELVEADNWWHGDNYYNVSLDDFIEVVTFASTHGYGICICGDVSEPGFDRYSQCGVIPSFDIPSEYIDENARQFRLSNASTTDDHCMHVIGFYKDKGKYWFLLKDSGAGTFDAKYKGLRFVTEDYIRLKMMNLLLYKEAAKPVLDKIIK